MGPVRSRIGIRAVQCSQVESFLGDFFLVCQTGPFQDQNQSVQVLQCFAEMWANYKFMQLNYWWKLINACCLMFSFRWRQCFVVWCNDPEWSYIFSHLAFHQCWGVSCFEGFGDDSQGFFTVYRELFEADDERDRIRHRHRRSIHETSSCIAVPGGNWCGGRTVGGKMYPIMIIVLIILDTLERTIILYCFNRPPELGSKPKLFVGCWWRAHRHASIWTSRRRVGRCCSILQARHGHLDADTEKSTEILSTTGIGLNSAPERPNRLVLQCSLTYRMPL